MTPVNRGFYEYPVLFVEQPEGREEMFDVQYANQARAYLVPFQGAVNSISIERQNTLSIIENYQQLLMNSGENTSNLVLLNLKQQVVSNLIQLRHTEAEFDVIQEAINRIPNDINTSNVLQIIDGFNMELKVIKERVGYDEKIYTIDHLRDLDNLLEEEEKSLVLLWDALIIDTLVNPEVGSEIGEWLKDIEHQPLLDTVTSLDLRGTGIALLPLEMRYLRNMQEIELGNNQIKFLPEWISCFVKLKKLNVSNNMLSELPVNLCKCNSLEELYVSNNQIRQIPIGIKNLRSLKILRAVNNPLRISPQERASWGSVSIDF